MNFSRSYTDWGEDELQDASQMFRQIQASIAKSRKIVQESVVQTRENNEHSDLHSPTHLRLHSPQRLTQYRESAISDLKTRIQQLETTHKALAEAPQVVVDLNQQLKAAISQRDQYEREAASLRTTLNDLEARETRRGTTTTQSLSHELEQEVRKNAKLTQLVATAKSQSQIRSFSTEKLQKFEEKLANLENAHMSQVRFNEDLARKLEIAKSETESVWRKVSELVSEQDLNMGAVQCRLEESEEQCERLRNLISRTECSVRPRTDVSEKSLGKNGIQGKRTEIVRLGRK